MNEQCPTPLLTRKQLALIGRREWRLDNLYRIVNETGQNVPFARNDVQQRMWDELWFWNIILKGRQHGISWDYGKHYGPHDLDHSHWVLPGRIF